MKSVDNVGVTFINTVVGRGIFNGVVNLSLGVFQFTPTEDDVLPDQVICSRLRMDIPCAKQLRDVLNDLLTFVEQQGTVQGVEAPRASAPAHVNGMDAQPAPSRVKPN